MFRLRLILVFVALIFLCEEVFVTETGIGINAHFRVKNAHIALRIDAHGVDLNHLCIILVRNVIELFEQLL